MNRQGASLPWSGTRAAISSMARRVSGVGDGGPIWAAGMVRRVRRYPASRSSMLPRPGLEFTMRAGLPRGFTQLPCSGGRCGLSMIRVARLGPLAGLLLAFASPAAAQSDVGVGLDLFAPGLIAPTEDFGLTQPDALAPVPYTPPIEAPPAEVTPHIQLRGASHDLALEARLVDGGAPLADGLTWRVFATEPGEDGKLPLLVTAKGGATTVQLAPGDYLVHAAFGRAGATKR